MANATTPTTRGKPFYIESDGKPMGESQQHIENLLYLLEPLKEWFAADPMAFVAGNLFVHYERGNRNRHVSPDVFVVKGVAKEPKRRNYLVWEEGKAPELVIEVTSASTRRVDEGSKRDLYQDVLRVQEYFLFDPYEEYLHPRLQGYRLVKGVYRPIRPLKGRLPSRVLGLHLEADDDLLRLYDPSAGRRLPTPPEAEAERAAEAQARQRAEAERAVETKARLQAEADARRAEEAHKAAEAEVERLLRENEELRRRLS